jgi:hypothetical protein
VEDATEEIPREDNLRKDEILKEDAQVDDKFLVFLIFYN